MSLGIAIKAFFAALGNNDKADQIGQVLAGKPAIAATPATDKGKLDAEISPKKAEPLPQRNAAIALMASLQREARLVDLIQEDLAKYSDAQVGAAARPCLQQCAGVLTRVLGLKPLLDSSDGDTVSVEENSSATRYQWIGEGAGTSGKLVHHGWIASKVELPSWTGDAADSTIVAPAQIQAP